MKIQPIAETPSGDDTEEYIKDVRKVTADERIEVAQLGDKEEQLLNAKKQEENKTSQKNTECQAYLGDASDEERSALKKK